LKIHIPLGTNEYFWIANHQKISVYDGISRGGKQCWNINHGLQYPPCDAGKGLYIYHETPQSQQGYCPRSFDLENADGKWNWVLDRLVPNFYTPPDPVNIPLFEHIDPPNGGNPQSGKGEYLVTDFRVVAVDSQWVTDNRCSDLDNDYHITLDYWGDGLDAYNMNYDEIFSPYSNPASNSNLYPTTNTGITIRLTGQEGSDITVKVYFNDVTALAECPPSKPKNLKVTKEIIPGPISRFHPKLNWDANIEPDFNNAGDYTPVYKIYRGI
jgi:hypothetical protein